MAGAREGGRDRLSAIPAAEERNDLARGEEGSERGSKRQIPLSAHSAHVLARRAV